jgi:hypothetical protein
MSVENARARRFACARARAPPAAPAHGIPERPGLGFEREMTRPVHITQALRLDETADAAGAGHIRGRKPALLTDLRSFGLGRGQFVEAGT